MNAHEVILFVQLQARAEHRDELIQLLTDLMDRSRVAPECVAYELFERGDDENTFVLFQTWGSREAYETQWLYIDAARINANSHLLRAPIEARELKLLV